MPKPNFLLIGLLLTGILLAMAGGTWLVLHRDSGLATNAPSIPAQVDAAQRSSQIGDAASSDVRKFVIVPGRSKVTYAVDVQVAGLPFGSTAAGSSHQVEGELHLTPAGGALAGDLPTRFDVDLTSFTSNTPSVERGVRAALETTAFPRAHFTALTLTGYDPSIAAGQEQSLKLGGLLNLHGVEHEVTWDVKARLSGDFLTALATTNIVYAAFNIHPDDMGGMVSAGDQATLQVQIVARRAVVDNSTQ